MCDKIVRFFTNPKEDPDIDHQTEAKDQTDIQQHTRVGCLRKSIALLARRGRIASDSRSVGDLCTAECKEEKQKGTAELGSHGNELIAPFAGEAALISPSRVLLLHNVSVGSLAFLMVVVVMFSGFLALLAFLVLLVKR